MIFWKGRICPRCYAGPFVVKSDWLFHHAQHQQDKEDPHRFRDRMLECEKRLDILEEPLR